MNAIDSMGPVVFWVALIFFFGIVGRYFALRAQQPGVLGELLMGMALGNVLYFFGNQTALILREGSVVFDALAHLLSGQKADVAPNVLHALQGLHGADRINIAYVLDGLARFGVIFLLFMVGLESSVSELKKTGCASIRVALIGVVMPMMLGFSVVWWLNPNALFQEDLFVAATLAATSVGITARILKELNQLKTREASTIMGAAMIDDVLGLVILSMVSNVVVYHRIDVFIMMQTILASLLFFATVLWMGPWLIRRAVGWCSFLAIWEAKLFIAFLFLLLLSWIATLIQLSTIIGAFSAGVVLHDGFFSEHTKNNDGSLGLKTLIAPLEALLAPLFFMLIGMQVKIESFADNGVLLMALGLTVVAVIGKLLAGLGAHAKDDRWLIGLGMLPRGEVGIVFASIGRTLGVISDGMFSAIILMVVVTTLITPIALKWRIAR